MNHIKPTTNKLQSHLAFQEYQSCLAYTTKNFCTDFFKGSNIFNRNLSWEYCLKFSLLIIWCFLYQLNWLVLLILSMLFQIICIGEIICTTMRHNLICEHNNYNTFLGSHIPLSIYSKTTPHSLENKIIINTLVFIRWHCISLFCLVLFIYCYSLFCFIHYVIWFWFYHLIWIS